MSQGTQAHLELAAQGRELAPHCREAYDLRACHDWMVKAAVVIERLAPLDPEVEVIVGEN